MTVDPRSNEARAIDYIKQALHFLDDDSEGVDHSLPKNRSEMLHEMERKCTLMAVMLRHRISEMYKKET